MDALARDALLVGAGLVAGTLGAAGAFLLFGPVRLAPALWLGVGLLAGSALGPSITRRAPEAPVRGVVAALGAGLAFWLLAHPG